MTDINRHNYEEYFLLYADGELSETELDAVDAFVNQNTDLKAELDVLLRSKLDVNDAVIFESKNSLYKSSVSIHPGNYEEQFLFYIDNELSATQKKEVENFVEQNLPFKKELNILQSLKLEKETTFFANKESLYRKERKLIIWLNFTKLAVAAAFIGLAFLVWSIIPSSNNNRIVLSKPESTTVKGSKPIVKQSNNTHTTEEKSTIVYLKKDVQPVKKIQPVIVSNKTIASNNDVVSSNQPKEIIAQTINTPEKDNNIVKAIQPSADQVIYKTLVKDDNDEQKNIYKQTVYKELNTDDETGRNKVYLGNIEVNKDRVRGLLRRAKGLFNKAKDDDDKVAIASFAVSKSLK
jgi:hypothetical protein